MTFRHVKAAVAFFVFDNAGMWGHAKKRRRGGSLREKGRTGAGAVKREGRSGTGVFA
jgi:hypothetical protein